tara:strand:- start:2937 stop:3302 length:366 start_codon:yes stop_codon:yes gene_type:complete
MKQDHEPFEIALSVALERMAIQLRSLHRIARELEYILGDALQDRPHRPDPRLQSLDFLIQSLDGLTLFLEDLAPDLEPCMKVDLSVACRRIVLRDLQHALASGDVPDKTTASGDAEFFGLS